MSLARQGYYLLVEEDQRRRAGFVALLLTGLTGTAWTADQLLGTTEEATAAKAAEGNAKIEALQERMKLLPKVEYVVAGTYDGEA